jgi:RimJ/RimL family protein N-acetyltransferase
LTSGFRAVRWRESTSSRLIEANWCFPPHVVTDLLTPRLELHPIDVAEAERIVARRPGPADSWASDYPFEGDLAAVGAFLRATTTDGERRPFGYYRITRAIDGKAVGGIGFMGRPLRGCAEIGYGLTPSARGSGYASEALTALLTAAAQHGVGRLVSNTTIDNIASQVTLSRAGFHLVRTDGELRYYEVLLGNGVDHPPGDTGKPVG